MNIYDAARVFGLTGDPSEDEMTALYRKLCSKYHPDRNPAGLEMMKAVNAAYEALRAADYSLSDVTIKTEGADYGDALNDVINALLCLAGLDLEICGSWLWISGDTKPHKEILKEQGCRWHRKKTKWYLAPEGYKPRRINNETTMEEIRDKYGSSKPERMYKTAITHADA